MYYINIRKKSLTFKILFFIFSVLVACYSAYLLVCTLIKGIDSGLSFDDIILSIAILFALLFEGSIAGFAARSFKAPTILMKNLVFKRDGTPYKPGIISIFSAAVVTCLLSVLFFISAYVHNLFTMEFSAQCFILNVLLILFVNFSFTTAYFFVFKHESGSFEII